MNEIEAIKAGTGEMLSLSQGMKELEKEGYTENLSFKFDHFSTHDGNIDLFPEDFKFDAIIRFENSSDPDDQAILYAVSSETKGIKGVHADTYGAGSEVMSPAIIAKIRDFNSN